MTRANMVGALHRATDSDAFERTARAGFLISGLLHLVVAYIIVRLAFGSGGEADQSGALATLAAHTGGTVTLWAAAIGLVALGLWRLAEAVIGKHPGENRAGGHQSPDAGDRAKALGLSAVYFAIAYSAARFAAGKGQQSSQQNVTMSARLMQSGWGKTLLVVAALAVIAVGGYHVYKGVTKRFLRDLKRTGGRWLTPLGVAGYTAKGIVLAGAGILLVVATFTADPAKASGLDAAVKTLGAAPFGKVLLVAAAAGFAAYGAYSFARSRYGRM